MIISKSRENELFTLCEKLKIKFTEISLLNTALTHTSYANEKNNTNILHNERLEFLGDAVLELAVSAYVYKNFSEMKEGDMTKLRAKVVCEAALCEYALKYDLGRYILLGKGEKTSGGRERPSILADAVEGLLGAYYLDQGFIKAQKLALKFTKESINAPFTDEKTYDYKTKLQEVVQKNASQAIYSLVSEKGPDHDKTFLMAVFINNKKQAESTGKSKKEAEQLAARKVLKKLGEL